MAALPIQRQVFASGFGNFRNFWFFNLNGGYSAPVIDDRLTRGGPAPRPAGRRSRNATSSTVIVSAPKS